MASAAVALLWQGVLAYGRWKHTIRFTFPDGTPAAHAQCRIWVNGWSFPINGPQPGIFGEGETILPVQADGDGIFRLNRRRANDPSGLYIDASAWKDGREHEAWVRLPSAKEASWPIRLTLHPY